MAIKNRLLRCVLPAVLFLFGTAFLVHSQTGPGNAGFGYGLRFVQRLSWTGDEYALRYEVVIEREEDGGYEPALRESTRESFIEVSLQPGAYHYRVIPYDFLDRPGQGSAWMSFEVRPVITPELYWFDPSPLSLEEGEVYSLDIYGSNLESGAEIYLRRLGGPPVIPLETRIDPDGAHARLFFRIEQFTGAGDYEIVIRNPGGLETREKVIAIVLPKDKAAPIEEPESVYEVHEDDGGIKFWSLAEIYLGAAWMPQFFLYETGGLLSNKGLSLAGAVMRFGVIYHGLDFLGLGMEFSMSWYSFSTGELELSSFAPGLSLLAQKRLLDEKISLNLRLGVGYNSVLSVNMGLSFLLLPMKHFYLEAGLDYTHFFTEAPSGYFFPWIGLGARL